MASANKGKNAKSVSAKKQFIQVNHEETRDLIISNISVFGEPMFEKCPKKDENGKQVFKNGNPIYSYYVKGLWALKTGEIHTIMISQSTMAFYDANTRDVYSFKINFEDKSEKDIKGVLDGKTIYGNTLKYSLKTDSTENTFVHRSVSFNAKINDLFNQTSKIAEAINNLLSGQVNIEKFVVPAKGLTILKKENFPLLAAKSKPFNSAASAASAAPAASADPAAPAASAASAAPAAPAASAAPAAPAAPAASAASAPTAEEPINLGEVLNQIETQREKITKLSIEETDLKSKILNYDEVLLQFQIEMKNKLDEGIKQMNKAKEENSARIEVIKNKKTLAIKKNETLSKLLIDAISKPIEEKSMFMNSTTKSWADID
jgi:hypothetical protein